MAAVFRRVQPLSWTRKVVLERPAVMLPSSVMNTRRQSFGTSIKVILTDDVAGTGYRGEYVEVKSGFMRNYLFPSKRAMYATEDNKILYESVDRHYTLKRVMDRGVIDESAAQMAERERAMALKAIKRGRQEMESIPIILKRHLPKGETRLEQAVTAKHICGYLQKNLQFKGTQEDIRMPNRSPIVSLAKHVVLVRIPLSEAAVAILQRELGLNEFEKQAWVEMTVHVEKTKAKDAQKLEEVDIDMEEETQVEEETDSQERDNKDASINIRA